MTARTPTATFAGVANVVEWSRGNAELDLIDAGSSPMGDYLTRALPPVLPRPGGDLRTARPGWWSPPVRGDDPLWPDSPGSDDLIRLYLDHGVRALVERADLPWRWWENRHPWD